MAENWWKRRWREWRPESKGDWVVNVCGGLGLVAGLVFVYYSGTRGVALLWLLPLGVFAAWWGTLLGLFVGYGLTQLAAAWPYVVGRWPKLSLVVGDLPCEVWVDGGGRRRHVSFALDLRNDGHGVAERWSVTVKSKEFDVSMEPRIMRGGDVGWSREKNVRVKNSSLQRSFENEFEATVWRGDRDPTSRIFPGHRARLDATSVPFPADRREPVVLHYEIRAARFWPRRGRLTIRLDGEGALLALQ